jgi:hypothetical protein
MTGWIRWLIEAQIMRKIQASEVKVHLPSSTEADRLQEEIGRSLAGIQELRNASRAFDNYYVFLRGASRSSAWLRDQFLR